jgi:hypothetical protein
MLMVKTTSLVLFSFLAITLLLSTIFARIGIANAQESTSNQQIQTRTAPPQQYDGIQGNTFSQSNICTNNACHVTTCIDNQCQTTDNNGGASSSTSNQQIQTRTAPPQQ